MTMCSTSWIEPVRLFAGSASALRIDAGSIEAAAAAPSELAAKRRKSRREFDIGGHPGRKTLAAIRRATCARTRMTEPCVRVRPGDLRAVLGPARSVPGTDDDVMHIALRFLDARAPAASKVEKVPHGSRHSMMGAYRLRPRISIGGARMSMPRALAEIRLQAAPLALRISTVIAGVASMTPWAALAGDVLPVTSCADDGSPGTLRSVAANATLNATIDLTALTCSAITLVNGAIEP